jgi:glyoxylase-like metal-dependent hydrolase (beta-lactamase superfamily II)
LPGAHDADTLSAPLEYLPLPRPGAGNQSQVVRDLEEGVLQFQSPLWQTNSLLAVSEGQSLLCDPALTPEEVEVIGEEARQRGASSMHLLLTHADFDHTCGIASFPEAEICCGEETAELIRTGVAAGALRSAAPEWGVSWRDELRVDRVLVPDTEARLGPFWLFVLDVPSHGREGLGFVLRDQGILIAADNVSAVTFPLLGGPLERAREAQERLLEALDRYELRWVVPGHGPALAPEEARRIAQADLGYLERLGEAAGEAVERGLAPGYALLHVYAVEPPRQTTPDFEIYDVRAGNARSALAELRERTTAA